MTSTDRVEPRTRRGRATRDAIVKAARKLFVVDGYLNVGVPDIARAAGRSLGSFYTYFESKEALLRILADEAIEHLRTGITAALDGETAATELISQVTEVVWDAYREDFAVLISLYQTATRDLVLDDWARLREVLVSTALDVGDRATSAAGIAPPADPVASARAVASLLESSCATWISERPDSPASVEAGIDRATAIPTLVHMWTSLLGIPHEPTQPE